MSSCCSDGLLTCVRRFCSARSNGNNGLRRIAETQESREGAVLHIAASVLSRQSIEEFGTPRSSRTTSELSFYSAHNNAADLLIEPQSKSRGGNLGCFGGTGKGCATTTCFALPRKTKLPRSVPRFFKNLGNRDPLFFPNRMPLQPSLRRIDAELDDDELILIAYHENGALGYKVMKLGLFLRKRDARTIMYEALQLQAPRKGESEQVLNEQRFNKDVERLLREKNMLPILRVVPETKWASKEDQRFTPVPGFRSFVEDLRRKVIAYDPRAKSTEDPEWFSRSQELSTRAVEEVMKLIPDDLQRRMIITFELRRVEASPFAEEDSTQNLQGSTRVLIHIDRSQLKGTRPENALSTSELDGQEMQAAFVEFWTNCWLQDYSNHKAVGGSRSLASPGWMPMQLRGLRDSFAQILTDTRQILFSD